MPQTPFRHGCQCVAVGAFAIAGAYGGEPIPVRSQIVDIEYVVSKDALPLDSVQLWYTLDGGVTWHESVFDNDRQSPVTFEASQEGLYGFFLVMTNSTGPSSIPPTRGTKPHVWAFVDYTPPVVQLHPPRQTTLLGQRVLQIRWTAIDAHFGTRPVEMAYQRPPDKTWHPIAPDPLPNTGRYDWRLPEEVSGSVAVRVTVSDEGGHRVTSEPQVLELTRNRPLQLGAASSPSTLARQVNFVAGPTALPGSVRAKQRAVRLFTQAVAHRERGEYREGIARLREAVKLDPRWAEAFAEMADMLYRSGDWDRALSAYQLALRQQPTMRSALRGAAMVYRQQNDFPSAARHLRTILRRNPNDAEVWLNLGDIAVYQGDEMLARECYTRATQIDPGASQTIEEARKRLVLMAEASRTYRQGSKLSNERRSR